jgi:hypothetical protein
MVAAASGPSGGRGGRLGRVGRRGRLLRSARRRESDSGAVGLTGCRSRDPTEHPRRLLRRPWTSLDGEWQFAADPSMSARVGEVDQLAALSLAVVSAGGTLRDLPAADMAELPDVGAGLFSATTWRHELARLG